MTSPEFADMSQQMMRHTDNHLQHYYTTLQHRFGDPRVYQQQEQAIRAQTARAMHQGASKNSSLLQGAYEAQQKKNIDTHNARMSKKRTSFATDPKQRQTSQHRPQKNA